VYAVIPTHNRLAHTLACLACLEQQDYAPLEVVVVDDGSTDGTSAAVASEFPRVTVLRGNGRLWWTGSMAMGVRHVRCRCSLDDYILCQNNDTLFSPDYVSTLVRVSRKGGGALVGSVLRSWDDGALISVGPKITWGRPDICDLQRIVDEPEVLCRDEIVDSLEALSGRGTLVPIRVFRRVGNFRRILLPHYIADYEFSARAKRRGERLLVSTRAVVYTAPPTPRPSAPADIRSMLHMFFSRRSSTNLICHLIFFAVSGPPRKRPAAIVRMLRGAARTVRGVLRASPTRPPRAGRCEARSDSGGDRVSPRTSKR